MILYNLIQIVVKFNTPSLRITARWAMNFPKPFRPHPNCWAKALFCLMCSSIFPIQKPRTMNITTILFGAGILGWERLILVVKTGLTPHGKYNAKGSTNVFFAVSGNGSAVVFNNFFGNG